MGCSQLSTGSPDYTYSSLSHGQVLTVPSRVPLSAENHSDVVLSCWLPIPAVLFPRHQPHGLSGLLLAHRLTLASLEAVCILTEWRCPLPEILPPSPGALWPCSPLAHQPGDAHLALACPQPSVFAVLFWVPSTLLRQPLKPVYANGVCHCNYVT